MVKIAKESFYDLFSSQSRANAETYWKEAIRIAETLRIDKRKYVRETEN